MPKRNVRQDILSSLPGKGREDKHIQAASFGWVRCVKVCVMPWAL